jgi:Tfp pilus assembly protein PilO
MFPMEVLAPVFGFVTIIAAVTTGIIAIRRFSPRQHPPDGGERQMLEDLQNQVAELDGVKQRLAELEERVDFAERLLARPREGPSGESR